VIMSAPLVASLPIQPLEDRARNRPDVRGGRGA
jgi:hypothetical protein